jgi:hypothetical protein
VVVFGLVRWIVVRLLRRDLLIPDREWMLSGACARECPNPSAPVAQAVLVVPAVWVALLALEVVPAVLVDPDRVAPWEVPANFDEVPAVLVDPGVPAVLVVPNPPQTRLACASLRKSPRT